MELKTQTFPESQFWFLETLTKPLLYLVLITIFTWIVTEIKCVRKHVMTCGVYRELYLLKSMVYYDYKSFSYFEVTGKNSFLLSSKDLALTVKVGYMSRVFMESVFEEKHWAGNVGGWVPPQLSNGHSIELQASHLDFLAPSFLSCKTRDELNDLSPSHSIILNVRHKFVWIRESLKLGKFQKII